MIHPETNRKWDYLQLNADINRLANALCCDGFQKGDVVMVQLYNCPEFAFTYVATQKVHGVCCPVNYRLSAGELAFNIDDSTPMALLFDVSLANVV